MFPTKGLALNKANTAAGRACHSVVPLGSKAHSLFFRIFGSGSLIVCSLRFVHFAMCGDKTLHPLPNFSLTLV